MTTSSILSGAVFFLWVASPALAWWRVACAGPLVTERVDPVSEAGLIPSQHVNTVHGANHFAANSTYGTLLTSTCTSCLVTQDKSNYLIPTLYFQDPVAKTYTEVPNGGLLIFYQDRGNAAVVNGGSGLKAFPPGFKMISGNPILREADAPSTDSTQWGLSRRAITHSCLRYGTNATSYSSNGFPTSNCEAGLNTRVDFPACWDGVNVDSADHRSHVAFLSNLDSGSCPSTHPIGIMKLFYEVTWDVNSFVTSGLWNPSTTAFPFVFSTGDPTGYGSYGEFQNGWDTTVLQNSIDKCNNPNDQTGTGVTEACSFLTVQKAADAATCKISPVVNEPVTGPLVKLPGCNPIQAGPGNATLYSNANCPA